MEEVQQIEAPQDNNHKPIKQGFLLRQGPPNIPDTVFQDIIQIWDTFRSFAEIVHDILTNKDENNNSEFKQVGVNVGQMQHFQKFFKNYFLHLSLNDFYECFKQIESNQFYVDILLFLSSFYLKQIIEDVEQESQYSRFNNKGSIWQLLNFLWTRDQEAYFDVIHDKVYELSIDIQNYGILQVREEEIALQDSFDVRLNLIKYLSEGLMELKKTSTLIQYRTESILFANRLRQTFGKDIRDTRGKLVVSQEALITKEEQSVTLKAQLEEGKDLSRQEQSKTNRQIDQIQKEIYKLRSQCNKEIKQLEDFQESYDNLDKTIRYSNLPQLYHNSSLFLGGDQDQTLYYFFLHDPVRIYYQKGFDSKRWGYINKLEQIEKLIKTQNNKQNKDQILKTNLQLLLTSKLLQTDGQIQRLSQNIVEFHEINSWKKLVEQFMRAEINISNYLSSHQGRWIAPDERKQFRSSLQDVENNEQGLREITRLLDYFIEKSVMQERLEIRNENDLNDDHNNNGIEVEEQENFPTNKKRVVEDESDSMTIQGGQLELLEHMDQSRIKIKKFPLKLFGNIHDSLRSCCIDLVRNIAVSQGDILLVVFIIERVIQDYVSRKFEKEQEQLKSKQQQIEEEEEEVMPMIQKYQPSKNLRIRPNKKPQYIENENNWEDQCKICSQTGKVICCDTCPSVFHSKCLGLKQVPMGKWSCFQCLSRMEAQIKTRSTMRKFQA